ncbi:chitin deacetylase-like isoform e [Micractinium conductrix]|uniref:Chitin deacetylase-like isoform e n=1 Tax=Micractinium conductrix TaxID=554055 RepID=A0A2P6VAE9_9CHLO|nr:chitin deacetylase-like isoform e [Micractinium conductrix]|eukprot:PSC71048.1 chitin deacetylase-like isoform e [Micractinium conductrix]
MLRIGLALLTLLASASAYPCTLATLADCPKPPGALPSIDQVPQFITITWDDAITPYAYDLVQLIVGGLKQRNNCSVPSTFFVTSEGSQPAAVQALYLGGSEIATHTMTHPSLPSAEEIIGARTALANMSGIPEEKINGFRAPFLMHDPEQRATLVDAGFLYDSSLADTAPSPISPSVTQRGWPYKMDGGIPQTCSTGSCVPGEAYPLWEIPLWAVADASQQAIAAMDPAGDAYENYKRELDWRLAGNRAPLGLFFHAGLQSEPARVAQLRQFIEYAASLPDVWFVTNQQMLAWMENPVPASRVALQLKCDRPTDISANGPACDTYVGDCKFGAFDAAACRCKCMGESVVGGYTRDEATGQCTAMVTRRWPAWSAIAAEPGAQWRRQYELLSLREAEAVCLPSVAAVRKTQQQVTERHRSILTEWLCEVSFDWELDSTIVFKAVSYLDHYLAQQAVEQLSSFQLLGLACLRAAMGDARKPATLAELDKKLDPANFAYISDDTYSAEEVEAQTQVIVSFVPEPLKRSPNIKMFLRSFWYRATLKGAVNPDEMHIYTLASFLVQLALLSLECSGHAPSLLAAAALSLSLEAFGKAGWPLALQQFGSYLPADLEPVKRQLADLQATQAAEQLRPIWRGMHEAHSYPEFDEEWKRAVLIFSCASRAHMSPPGAPEPPRSLGAAAADAGAPARAASPAPPQPQPQDSAAMLVD